MNSPAGVLAFQATNDSRDVQATHRRRDSAQPVGRTGGLRTALRESYLQFKDYQW
jgi:hypothetical protein